MRIFDRMKKKELQLSELNLDLGQLVSGKLRVVDANGNVKYEEILVYIPAIDRARSKIRYYKSKLSNTDYKAIKYAEGELPYSEFEVVKADRRAWRVEINKLEEFIAMWKD